MSADRRRGWARGDSAAYRIPARAPTRSPQGQRARQNVAKNPADLHAGRPAAAGPAGGRHRPAWLAESRPAKVGTKAEASESGSRRTSEFHPQPAKHAAGVRARRGQAAPAKAAHRRDSGGAVAASGAAIPRVKRS